MSDETATSSDKYVDIDEPRDALEAQIQALHMFADAVRRWEQRLGSVETTLADLSAKMDHLVAAADARDEHSEQTVGAIIDSSNAENEQIIYMLPAGTVVTDPSGYDYRRNTFGRWEDRQGYLYGHEELAQLAPLTVVYIPSKEN